MISDRTIREIMDVTRVEDVVGDFVTLKKRGQNYIGLCPFHNERTPSFNVSPAKNIYKCFGCGKAGDAITFLKEHEQLSYRESLEFLARRYNIKIEETVEDSEAIAKKQMEEGLYVVTGFAQQYFSKLLFDSDEGKSVGLSYFHERGYRDNLIEKFQLGYAVNSWDAFYKTAKEKGYSEKLLHEVGLISERKENFIDFFRGRVIFPIHNLSGKVIAFAGRYLKKEENSPKYINSPQTSIYDKSRTLFGLFQARNAIRQHEECFLVEGYTDVISMHQAGIENVVASSGTSLTIEQSRLMKRFTSNITILYDGDAAGMKAAVRGMNILLDEDLNVRLVLLPEGEDPDSFVQKHGTTPFREFVQKNATNVVLFQADLLNKETGNDPIRKAEAIREIVGTLAHVSDPIKRQLLLRECSTKMLVDERILIAEVNKLRRKSFSKEQQQKPSLPEQKMLNEAAEEQMQFTKEVFIAERDLMRILLESGNKKYNDDSSIAHYIISSIAEHPFEHPNYRMLMNEIINHMNSENSFPPENYFMQHPNEELKRTVIGLLTQSYELSENWEKMHEIFVTEKETNYIKDADSALRRYNLRIIDRMIADNSKEMREAEKSGNEEELMKQLQIRKSLNDLRKQLAAETNTVIVK